MNALRDLTAGTGCSADGTAATANPLTSLVNQTLGLGGQKGMPHQPGMMAPRGAVHGPQTDVERAMAAGMGLARGADARSPFEAGMMPQSVFDRQVAGGGSSLAMEFQQQFRGGPPAGLLGPRGHAPMPMAQEPWIADFQRMNVRGDPFGPQSMRAQGWIADMARGPPPAELEHAWRQKNAMEGAAWAADMAKQQEQNKEADDVEATRRATEDMVRVLSEDPKFRNSEFFDFMSKVSTGELKFENNDVVAGTAKTTDPLAAAWKTASEEGEQLKMPGPSMDEMLEQAWRDGEMNEAEMDRAFQEMMSRMQAEGGGFDYDQAWGEAMQEWGMPAVSPLEQPYELETNNPYAQNSNAFDEGMRLFHAGNLRDAVLAFQAVVGNEPGHSEAWRMLGVVHQENDEDKKAIQCMERAVENDAYNLDALLGLGVSYVNELDHMNALKNLKAWIINNPAFVGLEVQKDEYSDGTMMDEVMQLMLKAAEWAPKDAQVQEVLGVLFNVTRDYGSAAAAFKKAVDARPDDYSLWNKLGATLANSTPSRSEEAVPAYLRAIELRPGYARAHLNLGISYNNMGNFASAARAYMRALELSPGALHIWQYLRISFTCMERPDLVALCEARDLNAIKKVFN